MIQAIQTEYAGHLFRSRLEARWAVFFDSMKIEWRYEAQGYEDGTGARYLPDFHLPALNAWCEVKGGDEALRRDAPRMTKTLQQGGPVPLILLGEIPAADARIVFHPTLVPRGAGDLCRTWSIFAGSKLFVFNRAGEDFSLDVQAFMLLLGLPEGTLSEDVNFDDPDWSVAAVTLPIVSAAPRGDPSAAYRAARQARFEHGEKGRVSP